MQEQIVVNTKDLDYDEDDYRLYEDTPFTGVEQWFYDTGELGSEQTYIDGILDGLSRGWHKNGQIMSETFYQKGIVKGIYRKWHENGQLKSETDVGENKTGDVLKKEWDAAGNIIKEEKYNQ